MKNFLKSTTSILNKNTKFYSTTKTHIWLRDEIKKMEQRTALPPKHAKVLIDNGFKVTVERSKHRIFPDSDYEKINGIEMVDSFSFHTSAPENAYVLGLKELPPPLNKTTETWKVKNKHIYFAHCYKDQMGWENTMNRFSESSILDLEFLNYDSGVRVAAFGSSAGFSGMCMGLLNYISIHKTGKVLSDVRPVGSKGEIIKRLQSELKEIGKTPKVRITGGTGRCGSGSINVLDSLGIDYINLSEDDTVVPGPYLQLLDCDIFVNNIYLTANVKPFLKEEDLKVKGRRLSIFVDVSCDFDNPKNPFPFYDRGTNFFEPVFRKEFGPGIPHLDIIAIDHLPTFIPRESSEDFCDSLLPHLLTLKDYDPSKNEPVNEKQRVWKRAFDLFKKTQNLLKQ